MSSTSALSPTTFCSTGPSRGIDVHPDQIVVVGGCQEGFNLAARLLLREGMRVAIENPTYQGAAFLYESWRTRMIPVRVDDSGICVDDLPADGAALLHITPSHQYPLGFTLSLERRLRLLDWARRTGTCIVEDDYDSDFRYRGAPLAALMGLDSHGSVIYTGTFTKSLGAGLRLFRSHGHARLLIARRAADPRRCGAPRGSGRCRTQQRSQSGHAERSANSTARQAAAAPACPVAAVCSVPVRIRSGDQPRERKPSAGAQVCRVV